MTDICAISHFRLEQTTCGMSRIFPSLAHMGIIIETCLLPPFRFTLVKNYHFEKIKQDEIEKLGLASHLTPDQKVKLHVCKHEIHVSAPLSWSSSGNLCRLVLYRI